MTTASSNISKIRTAQSQAPQDTGERFEPNWDSLGQFEIPRWYQDAKFGIFIHWGVASVPAHKTEWYPKWMYKRDHEIYKHHLETYGDHQEHGYKHFIPKFQMENWDPEAWAQLFSDSGARYVVPVAEHHDGFALYDYDASRWTSLQIGPKRDLIGDLGSAIRRAGLKFGVSSHRAYNWRFFSYDADFDTSDPDYADLYSKPHEADDPADPAFLADWLNRSNQLVDKYSPDLVWFDWCIGWPEFEPYRREFAAHYYNAADRWGKEVVINYKEDDFAPGTGVWDIERGQLDNIRRDFWQTDTSISRNGWAYNTDPENKSATSLLHDLMDITSKNGCLLLNIGPRADGTITEEQQSVLREMGRWLKTNGEAVYGTRPWRVFGEGPTRVKAGTFQETENRGFTARDLRFTRKGSTIYVTTLGIPDNGEVVIRSFGSDLRLLLGEIECVEMIGFDSPIEWSRQPDACRIRVPDTIDAEHGLCFRVTVTPPPAPKKTADAAGSHTADIDSSD